MEASVGKPEDNEAHEGGWAGNIHICGMIACLKHCSTYFKKSFWENVEIMANIGALNYGMEIVLSPASPPCLWISPCDFHFIQIQVIVNQLEPMELHWREGVSQS